MPGTPGSRTDLPPTKTVTIYRNGDAFWPGRKVVVNPRQVSTFDTFLATLTKRIEAPFGAVRRLYTPTQGRRVRHLDELKHGSAYVAAGNEPFKTLETKSDAEIQPVAHSRIVASARWRKIIDGTCTINVFTNGKLLVAPVRVRIPKHTLKSWENVLAMVTEKVGLRTGAVFRLCKLDGQPVCGSAELENNQHYVAVGAEKFKPLPYDRSVPYDLSFSTAAFPVVHLLMLSQLCGAPPSPQPLRPPRRSPRVRLSVFNAQNKRSETAGAAEVQEDRQLKVDLPIDQVKSNPIHLMSSLNTLHKYKYHKINTAVSTVNAKEDFVFFAFMQVEASIVEEEQEDVDWDEVFQDDMEATSPQQSLTAVSRKAVSTLIRSFMQLCLAFSSFSVHYYVQFSHLLWN
uniref:Si:dkey-25g12.4 n=1 Tax=Kryptolebias marmoratus TaxID=37003 RepID=A0A3Q3A3N6_KRYMA